MEYLNYTKLSALTFAVCLLFSLQNKVHAQVFGVDDFNAERLYLPVVKQTPDLPENLYTNYATMARNTKIDVSFDQGPKSGTNLTFLSSDLENENFEQHLQGIFVRWWQNPLTDRQEHLDGLFALTQTTLDVAKSVQIGVETISFVEKSGEFSSFGAGFVTWQFKNEVLRFDYPFEITDGKYFRPTVSFCLDF